MTLTSITGEIVLPLDKIISVPVTVSFQAFAPVFGNIFCKFSTVGVVVPSDFAVTTVVPSVKGVVVLNSKNSESSSFLARHVNSVSVEGNVAAVYA